VRSNHDTHPLDGRDAADVPDGEEWSSPAGATRCTGFVSNGGRRGARCLKFAVSGYKRCRSHGAPRFKMARSRYEFGNKALNEKLEEMRDDEDYLSTRDELALARTMLLAATRKINGVDLDKVPLEMITLIEGWTADVTRMVEVTNKIERGLRLHISVDSLNQVVAQIANVIMEEVEDEQRAERIIEKLQGIYVPTVGQGPEVEAEEPQEEEG